MDIPLRALGFLFDSSWIFPEFTSLRQAPHSSPSTTTSSTPSSRPKRRDRATPPIVTDCYSFTLPLFYSFTLLLFHSSTLLLPTSSSPLDLNSSQTQQALLPPRRLLPLLI